MKQQIAKTIGVQEVELTMKPKGYCRIGMERLFLILERNERLVTDVLESANKEDNDTNLVELEIYPFTYGKKKMVLMELPMWHLDEYTEEEIFG